MSEAPRSGAPGAIERTPMSLARRLFILSAAWSLVAVAIAVAVLLTLFRNTVERQFDTLLDLYGFNLVAGIEQAADGALSGSPDIGDPRFDSFLSGWYWQVTRLAAPEAALTSPSLAGGVLDLPSPDTLPYDRDFRRTAVLPGPSGQTLKVVDRLVVFDQTGERISFVVAGAVGEVEAQVAEFRNSLILVFALLGAGLVAITMLQVRLGLRPLRRFGSALADIREGRAERITGSYPEELRPLARELNALIDWNAAVVERARTHVGNLAHALKTPLSVITNEGRAASGPLAEKVVEQASAMRHHLDHYLDRAQIAGRSRMVGSVTEVEPVVRGLERAMRKIYEERGLSISVTVAPGLRFQGERQDFEELVGNLLDNACKWAEGAVSLTAMPLAPGRLELVVEDDGPGLAPEQRTAAIERGRRLDTSKPGSGLGLSIVRELVDLYHGELALGAAPSRGLRVVVVLPAP